MSIVGTWKLVSCEHVELAAGKRPAKLSAVKRKVTYPFGKKPHGLLMYSQRGHMSVAIAFEKRAKFRIKNLYEATTKQKAAAMSSYLSYAGKYRVDGRDVVHQIELCLLPDWVGLDVRREVTLRGNLLTLSDPPFEMHGKKITSHLVWKRVEL
jgi:hypothetical protein